MFIYYVISSEIDSLKTVIELVQVIFTLKNLHVLKNVYFFWKSILYGVSVSFYKKIIIFINEICNYFRSVKVHIS